jgi:hypothetical protein
MFASVASRNPKLNLLLSKKVESNWKNKQSKLALAASLNLDKLDDDNDDVVRPNGKKTTTPRELFKNFDEEDQDKHTFELNHIDHKVTRDAPDFVQITPITNWDVGKVFYFSPKILNRRFCLMESN